MSSISASLRRSGLTRISSIIDVSSRSLHMAVEETTQSIRPPKISSRSYHLPTSNSNKISSSITYSSFRNKVSMPFEKQEGRDYVSPYSDFFANIEAGRSSLGTTEQIMKQEMEIKEEFLDCGIPESALRFKTTSYGRYILPPYVAPGEHRVTVNIPLSAIPFNNDAEKEILLQIVGSRYVKEKGFVQLSAEKFASRIENKRYLVDLIEQIVASSRRLAKEFEEEGDAEKQVDGKSKQNSD